MYVCVIKRAYYVMPCKMKSIFSVIYYLVNVFLKLQTVFILVTQAYIIKLYKWSMNKYSVVKTNETNKEINL